MPNEVRCEITDPFRNFNGAAVKVGEAARNFIPHWIGMGSLINAGMEINSFW